MKNILIIFLSFVCIRYNAQTITPNVINSAGGNWLMSNGMTVTDNVGEPFTSTIYNTNHIITQGFLQNFVIGQVFSVTPMPSDVSCKDKSDGTISMAVSCNLPYTVQYKWSPQSICPLNNCSQVDSLKAGIYTVTTQITYTVGANQYDSIFVNQITITDANGPCKVKIYTGVTLNGDGVNDVFTIDNISEFPNNHVFIYNRWGVLLFDQVGYDNVNKVWPRKDEDGKLTGTTYFYILYLGDGSGPIKGWIELMKE
ncbi:MAG: gliding motility-associated C-terminal domain-containing protein [Bacteroidetes bacterium]|nr:gliding motility-associated C-terminal domain-containing protein [Bacteroidota bacterium]